MTRLEERLAALAAAGETVTYGALARDLGLRMAELTTALEMLMEEDAAEKRPYRAAVCAARLGEGLPARGFFDKAAALGHRIDDPTAFVQTERAALKASPTSSAAFPSQNIPG
ncbi:hypothetical protein [Tabrizicola sp.]|uniref:hypothetical protein n=1 Tax=Tabrizicola sp. TaxID=2005166 RepID=UPI00261D778E|nr:hypothetical protein [Tabrizicola sp.]MDM7930815.1 hypothetical protein [Tabrizicola sp.]